MKQPQTVDEAFAEKVARAMVDQVGLMWSGHPRTRPTMDCDVTQADWIAAAKVAIRMARETP